MAYRIIKCGEYKYKVEYRFLFWWIPLGAPHCGVVFPTEGAAKAYMEPPPKEIVYSE